MWVRVGEVFVNGWGGFGVLIGVGVSRVWYTEKKTKQPQKKKKN